MLHPTTPENDEEERQRIVQVLRETNGIVAGPRGAATRLGMK
ncbi:hydrogenase, partial [Shigella flexneri]